MIAYLGRRLGAVIPTVLGVVTVVFLLLHLTPGDPVDVMLGETARPVDKQALRRQLGLDRPLATQYAHFVKGLARGDLGRSLYGGEPVASLVLARYPATLELAGAGLCVALLFALPLGMLSAARPHGLVDRSSVSFALLGVSVPNFTLGPLLMLIFAIWLEWLPVSGRGGLPHLVLPALTLGTSLSAILTRMLRASLLERMSEDYIRTARAKGLPRTRIFLHHALRNAALPVVTIFGLQAGALLAGSIITETIFSWPGLGRLTLHAIQTRDYPLVQGCVLVVALSYVAINLLTDLLYAAIDPRVRVQR